jgi:hypothetical protein
MVFPRGSWRPKLLPRFTYQGVRYTEQVDARNRPLTPLETNFTIDNASGLQPIQGDMQLTLPENLRQKEVYWFTTTTKVKTVESFTTELSDRIIFEGVTYIMISTKPWRSKVLNHYEVMAVREYT